MSWSIGGMATHGNLPESSGVSEIGDVLDAK
jgi:hypothetical protein